ncbi:MAG: hypothetical protein MZV65_45830 [Chromatiales bacterium]|nr:hypothetical protein [Chromatiales bacterium]MCK7582211.1 hypothetical protein [Chromatiales bacterium]
MAPVITQRIGEPIGEPAGGDSTGAIAQAHGDRPQRDQRQRPAGGFDEAGRMTDHQQSGGRTEHEAQPQPGETA